jgi:hypothetical protein
VSDENKAKEEECQWEAYKKLPRYTVGLQKPKEPSCYVDFYETNSLTDAKEKADEAAKKEDRAVAVFDRHGFPSMPYKAVPNPPPEKETSSEAQKPSKIKRK